MGPSKLKAQIQSALNQLYCDTLRGTKVDGFHWHCIVADSTVSTILHVPVVLYMPSAEEEKEKKWNWRGTCVWDEMDTHEHSKKKIHLYFSSTSLQAFNKIISFIFVVCFFFYYVIRIAHSRCMCSLLVISSQLFNFFVSRRHFTTSLRRYPVWCLKLIVGIF